jgi:DNA-binding PadR family transcriptional regulator
MNVEYRKEIENNLMKGALDLTILQFLNGCPMHGYEIITRVRKEHGIYFGPSTVYPILNKFEEKGITKSEWVTGNERPKKVYSLTNDGKTILNMGKLRLSQIYNKIMSGYSKIVDPILSVRNWRLPAKRFRWNKRALRGKFAYIPEEPQIARN